MAPASSNDKSQGRARVSSSSIKTVVGNTSSSKSGFTVADVVSVGTVQSGKHTSISSAASPTVPTSPSAYSASSSSSLLPEAIYTKEETMLRQYSRDIYAYTLNLYNSQRIDSAHRGRAAALKRTVSDIAIPLKAMAVGDFAKS